MLHSAHALQKDLYSSDPGIGESCRCIPIGTHEEARKLMQTCVEYVEEMIHQVIKNPKLYTLSILPAHEQIC
jgi:hypothetical protein